jgi:hypothetical protein
MLNLKTLHGKSRCIKLKLPFPLEQFLNYREKGKNQLSVGWRFRNYYKAKEFPHYELNGQKVCALNFNNLKIRI